jgi:translation initiation factor IF-2
MRGGWLEVRGVRLRAPAQRGRGTRACARLRTWRGGSRPPSPNFSRADTVVAQPRLMAGSRAAAAPRAAHASGPGGGAGLGLGGAGAAAAGGGGGADCSGSDARPAPRPCGRVAGARERSKARRAPGSAPARARGGSRLGAAARAARCGAQRGARRRPPRPPTRQQPPPRRIGGRIRRIRRPLFRPRPGHRGLAAPGGSGLRPAQAAQAHGGPD